MHPAAKPPHCRRTEELLRIAKKKAKEEFLLCDSFETFQGEGSLTGIPALFVRLSGCNLKCSFCDEPLHRDKGRVLVSGDETLIVEYLEAKHASFFKRSSPRCVVITGGEPTLYRVDLLASRLKACLPGVVKICVESNGYNPLISLHGVDLYTFSPKINFEELLKRDDWIFEFLYKDHICVDIKLLYEGGQKGSMELKEALDILASYMREGESILSRYMCDFTKWRRFQSEKLRLFISPINYEESIDEEVMKDLLGTLRDYDNPLDFIPLRINTQMQKIWGVK